MHRSVIVTVVAILLLVPAIALAQGTSSEPVEWPFTDGGAQASPTLRDVAAVTVEANGRYLSVPVTIDIDTAVPLTSSLVTVPPRLAGQLGMRSWRWRSSPRDRSSFRGSGAERRTAPTVKKSW